MSEQPVDRVRGTAPQALAAATVAFFGGFAGVALFGPLVPKFAALLHLSPIAGGLLAAIPSLTGSLLRIPFGAWADRGSRRPLLWLEGIALAGMAALVLFLRADYPSHMAGTYPLLLLLGMAVGAGIAIFSVGVSHVSYWFPKARQGGALGTYAGLGNLASGLFSLLLPVAVLALGLTAAYLVWFAFLLAVTLLTAFAVQDPPSVQLARRGTVVTPDLLARYGQDTEPAGSLTEALRAAARVPATWALVVLYFISFGGFMALTSWLPTFWHGAYGLSLVQAGALTLVFSVLTSLVRVPGGILADRASIAHALSGNLAIIVAGSILLALAPIPAAAVAGMVIMAVGMGLQNAVVFKLVPAYVPQAVGGAAGWVGGLGAFGGFLLPPVFGALTAWLASYHAAFGAFWVLAAVGASLVAWLRREDARAGRVTPYPRAG